jgi:hypothetical protein
VPAVRRAWAKLPVGTARHAQTEITNGENLHVRAALMNAAAARISRNEELDIAKEKRPVRCLCTEPGAGRRGDEGMLWEPRSGASRRVAAE